MKLWELLLLALALSADAFTVSAAVGLTRRGLRHAFRIIFHFGLFQGLMALLGTLAGIVLLGWIEAWDHWFVLILLGFVGGRMILSAFQEDDSAALASHDLTRGATMVGLSIAVSIDALAAGISLPASGVHIVRAVLIIAATTSLMAFIAWRLAGKIHRGARQAALVLGGIVLIMIGVRTVLDHLSSF